MGNAAKWGLGLVLVCIAFGCGAYDPAAGAARSGDVETGRTSGNVTPPAYCDEMRDWPAEAIAFEEGMLRLVNGYRTSGSICGPSTHPLQAAPALRCAARLHSRDMNERDFYQHINPDGDGPYDRMEAVGYTLGPWGENIFKGPTTAEEAMDGFMESPGHCANIMSPEFSAVGIGVHDTSWTQSFSN
jgi:uncharacterized protein YkwD